MTPMNYMLVMLNLIGLILFLAKCSEVRSLNQRHARSNERERAYADRLSDLRQLISNCAHNLPNKRVSTLVNQLREDGSL